MPNKKQEDIYTRQASEQAIPPSPDYIREIIYESRKEPELEPGDNMDKVLTELAMSDAWKVLKKYINEKRRKLEQMTRESVRQDAFSLQNTGFRYLIFDQVDSFAQDIINKVDNTLKLKEMYERERQEKGIA